MGRLLYVVYHDDEKLDTCIDREHAISICKMYAANRVELLKRDVYYPLMCKEFGVSSWKEVDRETRYAFWDREREKYLKAHYHIKVIDTTPTPEEQAERHRRLEEELKKRGNKKKKIKL